MKKVFVLFLFTLFFALISAQKGKLSKRLPLTHQETRWYTKNKTPIIFPIYFI